MITKYIYISINRNCEDYDDDIRDADIDNIDKDDSDTDNINSNINNANTVLQCDIVTDNDILKIR